MAEPCPNCGSPYLLEKWLKGGPQAVCPNAECKYKRDLPKPEEQQKEEEPALAS